ncbi:MAG: quinol dehydrogenase ferredoxin subunit NapH [Sulfurospirillum sp.]|nr:quinol dehydrogenase ferredoxin subunit NapH [Sulfurospirillum sp.]MBP9613050.1 quinol dehydrogenase ferredoxin subunit NapH [Sulfurospirillum sp.]
MRRWLYKHRFLMMRRSVQLTVLALYVLANGYGLKVLSGNLSSSLLFNTIPLADPFALLQMVAAGAVLGLDVIIGGLIIVLFYMIVGGRAFCSWVCPVNMVTDSANWLRRVLYLEKIERKVWLGRSVRYWVIGLSLVLSFISGVAAFEMVSPIGIMHRGIIFGMGMGFAALLSLFLFDLFAVKNGWCGHICPLGGFYALIGKLSIIRVKHNQSACTLCMKCKEICPEKPVLSIIGKESGAIVYGECTNCGRCVEVCDDDALGFGVRNYINTNTGEKK